MSAARALHRASQACAQRSSPSSLLSSSVHHFPTKQHSTPLLALPPYLSPHQTPTRPFSTTPTLRKKGAKAARDSKPPASTIDTEQPADDPFDLTPLTTEITTTLERLKTDLAKLRSNASGRFNPEILAGLRVQPDKTRNETVALGELAQILPKGRVVQVLVGEKEHLKPITTAILTAPSRIINPPLTPQPDPSGTNPLLLILNIPPPTAETRHAALAEAGKVAEKANTGIRDARGKMQKKLKAMKKVRPDDLRKALALMEKEVEKGTGEVKKTVEGVKKGIESG